MNNNDNIKSCLVSIVCITYNHKWYIKQAIEGFLSQRTDFPFEILIHDDASTDGTGEIVEKYANRYPHLIIPILQTTNQYSRGVDIFQDIVFPRAKGKYIALCEGDDYWIDPDKIQKQADFLENNHDYGLVHGNCHSYYQSTNEWLKNAHNKNKKLKNKQNLRANELFNSIVDATYRIATATVMFRKELLDLRIPDTEKFKMSDSPMWLDFSQHTQFNYLDQPLSVYRVLPDSASRSVDRKKNTRFVLSMFEMRIYYSIKHDYLITDWLKNNYNKALLVYKVYDPDYQQRHPLFNPTIYQKFLYFLLNNNLFKTLFLKNKYTVKIVNKYIVRGYC